VSRLDGIEHRWGLAKQDTHFQMLPDLSWEKSAVADIDYLLTIARAAEKLLAVRPDLYQLESFADVSEAIRHIGDNGDFRVALYALAELMADNKPTGGE
jgi:hypothetical protein